MALVPSFTSTETDGWRTRLAGGAATHLSSHARHPRSATSDKTRAGETADLADSLKASQLAAGREPPFSVGRHRRAESQQQAPRSRSSAPRRPPAAAAVAGVPPHTPSGIRTRDLRLERAAS